MQRIEIENQQEEIQVEDALLTLIKNAVLLTLQSENFELACEIDISLSNNEEIKCINLEHRKIDKATDVLSFPIVDFYEGKMNTAQGDYDYDTGCLFLGDIVLSLEKAASQAKEYGHSFEREVAFLVTHGVFHLLGYDHTDKETEANMMQKQEAVLGKMGLVR